MEPFPHIPDPEESPVAATGEQGLGSDQPAPSEEPYHVPEGSRLETTLKGESLEYFLPKLPEREQQIILMRNGLGGYDKTTLDRTGQLLNLSREWIRQLENHALRKLAVLVEEHRRFNT